MDKHSSSNRSLPSRYRPEIRNALLESTYSYAEANEQVSVVITKEHDYALAVWNIDRMVEKIIKTKGVLFEKSKGKNQNFFNINRTPLGEKFLLSLKTDISAIREHFNQNSISIFFNLFADAIEHHNLRERMVLTGFWLDDEVTECIKALNDCIYTIRSEAKKPEFIFVIRKFQRRSDKNFKSLNQYFYNMFQCHSKILIVRLDLGYRKPNSWLSDHNPVVGYQEAKRHREMYLKKLRNHRLFEHLVGYAWRMEYGLLKGYHYHMVLMFNGHQLREDIALAKRCGQLWQDNVTEGHGLYFNCNAQKNLYKTRGVGLIHYADQSAMEGIKKIANYLTKLDHFIQLNPHNKDRTFGKGEVPKQPKIKTGRPRLN